MGDGEFILSIDTTNFEVAKVELKKPNGSVIDQKAFEAKRKLSKKLLLEVDLMLRKNDIKLKNLKEIEVNPGPGSFTGTRVGVAVANALGYGLEIPVNGKEAVEPVYSQPPKITKAKQNLAN